MVVKLCRKLFRYGGTYEMNNPNPLNDTNYWHICISGFLQDIDEPHGILRLYDEMGKLRNHRTFVSMCNWNSDWKAIAGNIRLMEKWHSCKTIVTVASYSWGSGWGLVQLAKALGEYGIQIQSAVLSDPVYKKKWLPFLTLFSKSIKLPPNIRKIRYFIQHNNFPRGHKIKIKTNRNFWSAYETVEPEKMIQESHILHEHMDDLACFHEAALTEAQKSHIGE